MNKSITRKRRTREHVIADLSVNFVERKVLLCGYTVEHPRHDYGYDLFLTTYNASGEPDSGEVRIQLKATDTLPMFKDGRAVPWRVSRSDLARWLYDPTPVILIVYDAQADRAYWLYVQRYFEQLDGFNLFSAPNTVSVHIPTSNVLDQASVRRFSDFREQVIRHIPQGIHSDESSEEV